MSDLDRIETLTDIEKVKGKRTTKRGRITRLRSKIEATTKASLRNLRLNDLEAIKFEFEREVQYHDALQCRYQTLLAEKPGITEAQLDEEQESASELLDQQAGMRSELDRRIQLMEYYKRSIFLQDETEELLGKPDNPFTVKQRHVLHEKISTFLAETIEEARDDEIAPLRRAVKGCRDQLEEAMSKSMPGTTATPPTRATMVGDISGSHLKVKLPTFSGEPTSWKSFMTVFQAGINKHGGHLTSQEKCSLLQEAVKPETAKRIVSRKLQLDDGYSAALQELEENFGSPGIVFRHLAEKLLKDETYNLDRSSMRKIRERAMQGLQDLEAIGACSLSQIMVVKISQTFSKPLQEEWSRRKDPSIKIPTIEQMMDTLSQLEHDSFIPETIEPEVYVNKVKLSDVSQKKPSTSKIISKPASKSQCALCHEQHGLYKCPVFVAYDVDKRLKHMKDIKGCTNCLSTSHTNGNCPSSHNCRTCNGRHNTLLHKEERPSPSATSTTVPTLLNVGKYNDCHEPEGSDSQSSMATLDTAMVTVTNGPRTRQARMVLDSGAVASLITESLATHLKLKRHPRRLQYRGAGGGGISKHYVEIELCSMYDPTQSLLLKPSVVSQLPPAPFPSRKNEIAEDPRIKILQLADPSLGGPLDILVGIRDRRRFYLGPSTFYPELDMEVSPTIFGWTISGSMDEPNNTSVLNVQIQEDTLQESLHRLWELDKTPESPCLDPKDEAVMFHFNDTHQRQELDGRYKICLPRIDNPPQLGQSRHVALKRFVQNEKSLEKRNKLPEFTQALAEYLAMHHAEPVPSDEVQTQNSYYLPIHGVFKATSSTTKVRPVFDASARTTNGLSLNDILETGPNLYPLLPDVLIRFRLHQIGFSVDISKMFREIVLHEDDRDLHRFLMKDAPKALGMHWEVSTDTLRVATPTPETVDKATKRKIASETAKVFDVLGLFSPVTIRAKILLQKLWQRGLGWDQQVPEDVEQAWHAWTRELPLITQHAISRRYSPHDKPIQYTSLHGFSDALNEAYGAVIYLRYVYQDATVSSSLVMAKARVAPLKAITTPRAELVAAYLLARLMKYVSELLHLSKSQLFAWTDSSIVLCWLRKSPTSLKTFVAHRVSAIRDLVPVSNWRHVPSGDNPADLLSRGVPASKLTETTIWWQGPKWLLLLPQQWPQQKVTDPGFVSEVRGPIAIVTPSDAEDEFWNRYSSFQHMVRIYAWVRRFFHNTRSPRVNRQMSPHFTSKEIRTTKLYFMRMAQEQTFHDVFQTLIQRKAISRSHSLAKYTVSLDPDGLLNVSGRVRDYRLSRKPKLLIPLSLKSGLTRLMVETLHRTYLHPGVATLLSIIGDRFYIPGLRNFLKRVSKRCSTCQKAYANTVQQQMGLLPSVRTTPSPPFTNTGVDFASPFQVRQGHTRKPVLLKTYACLFVCLTTKAIHIELCADLSTDEFMAALRRFCARRGTPATIHSDNGSNFIGAHNEVKELQQLTLRAKQDISHFCGQTEIEWNFIPPRTHHFGGIWEAGVKSMKTLLRKLVSPHPLRFHELSSVLTEVEAVLNSRPLTPLNATDAEDQLVLTPGHFLIGRPLVAPPTRPACQAKISSLRRWHLVQRLNQDLWTAWQTTYLQSLQARSKWTSGIHNFKVGDVVCLRDDTLVAYRRWPLARITATYPGDDSIVRTVDVRCNNRTYRRTAHQLIPLLEANQPPPLPQYVQVRQTTLNKEADLAKLKTHERTLPNINHIHTCMQTTCIMSPSTIDKCNVNVCYLVQCEFNLLK